MLRRILVPLDGSECAEQALPLALEITRRLEANLWLVRVSPLWDFVYGPVGSVAPYADEVGELLRAEATEYLSQVRARLARPGLTVTTAVLEGPVAGAISHYARAQQIDLIVIASRGHVGLGRWVHRNVAERVQQGAPCPTLIVPGRPIQSASAARRPPAAANPQRLRRH